MIILQLTYGKNMYFTCYKNKSLKDIKRERESDVIYFFLKEEETGGVTRMLRK